MFKKLFVIHIIPHGKYKTISKQFSIRPDTHSSSYVIAISPCVCTHRIIAIHKGELSRQQPLLTKIRGLS
uniref:Uncharacterized protein n=1 Tax=Arundo donax TaxID=35708 RepID=A0A0A9RNH4_ARUDO